MEKASVLRRAPLLEDASTRHAQLGPAVPSRQLPHRGACILATSMICPEERMSAEQLLQHVLSRSKDAMGRGGLSKLRSQLQGLLQYVKVTRPLSSVAPVCRRLLPCG